MLKKNCYLDSWLNMIGWVGGGCWGNNYLG